MSKEYDFAGAFYACPQCHVVWETDRLAGAWWALAEFWETKCEKEKNSHE